MQTLSTDELKQHLAGTLTKVKVNALQRILLNSKFDLRDLVDMAFDPDPRIGFRAAWLMDHALAVDPEKYLPVIEHVFTRFTEVVNPSCRRHFARIAARITSPKAAARIKDYIARYDTEPLVTHCFTWVIDEKVLVAVKAHACEALFNLSRKHEWIAEELPEQLRFLMRNGSAAMQAKGKKLLAALEKQKSASITKIGYER